MTTWTHRFKTGWLNASDPLQDNGKANLSASGPKPDTGTMKVFGTLVLCIVCGFVGVAIALRSNGTIARGLLWAGAWSSVGWFLGFLFGIPRFLSTDTARTPAAPGVDAARQQLSSLTAAARIAGDAADVAKDAKAKADQAAATLAALAALASTASNDAAAALLGDPGSAALAVDAQSKAKAANDAVKASDEARTAADNATSEAQSKASAAKAADAAVETAKANLDSLSTKATTARSPSVTVNTNLEQISDWLTKIIVGVSLVESQALLLKMHGAATFMARSMLKAGGAMPQPLESVAALLPASADATASGASAAASAVAAAAASASGLAASAANDQSSTVIAIAASNLAPFYSLESVAYAMMVYFLTTGLLGSYLLTRLYLQRVLQEAASD